MTDFPLCSIVIRLPLQQELAINFLRILNSFVEPKPIFKTKMKTKDSQIFVPTRYKN